MKASSASHVQCPSSNFLRSHELVLFGSPLGNALMVAS